jgi:hypothetical protein
MNSIRYIQHPLKMGYLWLILIMSDGPHYVPSASSTPPYTIDCQLPTLPDRGNILSSGHISTFVSLLLGESRFSIWHTVHQPHPSSGPILLQYGL